MRLSRSTFLLLPALTTAVSLSDFRSSSTSAPTTDLSAPCAAIYRSQIPSCSPSDFSPSRACSAACVDGVLEMQVRVQKSCKSDDVEPGSVVGFFLAGRALEAVCPGANPPNDDDEEEEAAPTTTKAPAKSVPNTQPAAPKPTIGESTLRLSSVTSPASGLLVETSPSPLPSSTKRAETTAISTRIVTPVPSSTAEGPRTTAVLVDTGTVAPGTSTRRPTAEGAQRTSDSSSRGGSPFEIGDNAAGSRVGGESLGMAVSLVVVCWLFA